MASKTSPELRYIVWLAVSGVLGVVGILLAGTAQSVFLISATVVAGLPLSARVIKASMLRRASIAIAAVVASGIWLIMGEHTLAFLTASSGLALLLLVHSVLQGFKRAAASKLPQNPLLVRVVRADRETRVAFEKIRIGDRVAVRRGEHIPVDGRLISDSGRVSYAPSGTVLTLTGGDAVTAGFIALSNIVILAESVGQHSTNSVVHATLKRFLATEHPALKVVDVSMFVLQLVWIVGVITFAVADRIALQSAALITLCGVWWLAPVLIRAGLYIYLKKLLKHGVVLTSWRALVGFKAARSIIFNYTGTLTSTLPIVTEVIPGTNFSAQDVLRVASSLEQGIDHPIARAVRHEAYERDVKTMGSVEVEIIPSLGIQARVQDEIFVIGSVKLLSDLGLQVSPDILRRSERAAENGATIVHIASQQTYIGTLVLSDVPQAAARDTVHCLRRGGKDSYAISGAQASAMQAALSSLGIANDQAWSGLTPSKRAEKVREIDAQTAAVVADPASDAQLMQAGAIGLALGGRGDALAAPYVHIMLRSHDIASLCTLDSIARALPKLIAGAASIATAVSLVSAALLF